MAESNGWNNFTKWINRLEPECQAEALRLKPSMANRLHSSEQDPLEGKRIRWGDFDCSEDDNDPWAAFGSWAPTMDLPDCGVMNTTWDVLQDPEEAWMQNKNLDELPKNHEEKKQVAGHENLFDCDSMSMHTLRSALDFEEQARPATGSRQQGVGVSKYQLYQAQFNVPACAVAPTIFDFQPEQPRSEKADVAGIVASCSEHLHATAVPSADIMSKSRRRSPRKCHDKRQRSPLENHGSQASPSQPRADPVAASSSSSAHVLSVRDSCVSEGTANVCLSKKGRGARGVFEGRYDIGIHQGDKFKVRQRILGTRGQHIQDIKVQTKSRLLLRGSGSGKKEGRKKTESAEPLHLCFSSDTEADFLECKLRIEALLRNIYKSFRRFCESNGEDVADLVPVFRENI